MANVDVSSVDPAAGDLLSQARQQALSSLPPDLAARAAQRPIPGPGPSSVDMSAQFAPPQAEPLASSDTPPEGAENPFDSYSKPPEGAEVPGKSQETHGNGDIWSLSNMHDFLRDEFKGTGAELKSAVPRALGKLGKATMTLLGGAGASIADHAADVITGKSLGTHHGAEDAVFDYVTNYIQPAIESLTPQRAGIVGQDDGSGGAAQAIGGAAEMAPAMLAGGVPGAITLATQAGTNTATEALDKGHALRTAAAEGAVDTVATAIQAMVPGGGLPLVKRVLVQVPAGDLAAIAGDFAKKRILQSAGHQKEADAIDPMANLGQDTLQNLVFAALGGHKEPTTAAKELPQGATPPPEAQPVPGQMPPVAKAAAPQAPTAPPAQAAPAAAHPVGDAPSAEPAKDLQAQFVDMNNKGTPRTGVLVPKGSEVAAGKTLDQARAQGRVLDVPQGQLVLKSNAEMLKAKQEIKNTGDTEALIGRVTGAGDGKAADQTVVVQGQTPDGAVVSEGMVKPSEAQARVNQMVAEGKKPVVTTPEAAVQRRATEIATEAQTPPDGAEVPSIAQIQRAQKLNYADAAKAREKLKAEPAATEPAKPVTEEKPSDEEVEDNKPTASRAIVKTAAGERAVILEGAAENGRQKVRLLDDDGEPSDQVVTVPSEAVRSGKPVAPEPGKSIEPLAAPESKRSMGGENGVTISDAHGNQIEGTSTRGRLAPVLGAALDRGADPAEAQRISKAVRANEMSVEDAAKALNALNGNKPAKAVAAPMLDQLSEASKDFEQSQQPQKGRKYSGSVKDRAQAVGDFARVLKSVAGSMEGEDAAHAVDMAKKAERIDLKSDEAIAKGQGVGHTELSAHAENLLNAARKLIDPEFKRPEPKSAIQEKLKQKVAAKKAEPKEEPKPEAKKPEPEKVKVIEDVPDETKPRELTKGEQIRLKQAGDRLIRAKDEDADARAADVERVLKEVYGDRMSPDDHDTFMAYLMAERRDRLKPTSRDEEIEKELGTHGIDYRSAEPDEFEARILGAHEVSPEMANLHANLERSGMYSRLRAMSGKGQFGSRAVLQHMASVAKQGPLRDFLTKLAIHQPEGAVIRPVDAVRSRNGAELKSAGIADMTNNTIQLRMKTGGDTRLTHALMHEAVHLATMHVMRDEAHPAVREAKRLYQIFGQRMARRLGDKVVAEHIDYHRGTGPQPKDMINNLYGLHSPHEFMAEAMSNPKFQQLIAESEKFRDVRSEGPLNGFHKLADAVVGAIRRALNVITGREAKLLHSVLRNVEDVMDAQKKMDVDRAGAASDLAAVAHLNDDPKPLKDEPRLRGIVGRTGSVLARQFYRASQGRAVPAMRRLIMKNETHDQIIRSNAHWFGKDDERNPLRQYDDAVDQKNAIINRHLEKARPVVLARQRLDRATDTTLGNLQNDSTRWGIDPSKDKSDVHEKYTKAFNFEQRWQDLQDRWKALPEEARQVYKDERDHYQWAQKQLRRTAVDAALDTFADRDITTAQRSLLYNARTRGDFEGLIGDGKLVDVGDRNDSLRKSLQELAAVNHMTGPYFHLGRHGEYVVQVHPDVDENFESQHEAEAYAQKIRDMGPGSSAKVAEVGGKWNVEGNAQYVSMHKNSADAEEHAQALRDAGHKVGQVTQKIEAESGGALTKGMQNLIGEATRKLAKRGDGPEVRAMSDALRGTFVQMVAARSAYAASKLARAGFAGVKGEEMGRNFASHAQSMAWNIGNLATTFKQGEALGRVREMSKRPESGVPQKTVYKRGAVMEILGKRLAQEVSQYGLKNPINAITSKLGYMNFLASPSHTGIYLTQNFTTAYPVAGARWGYGKALSAFTRATAAVVSPTMRATFKAAKPGEFGADDMTAHVIDAIKQHPEMGKWAPALRELMDRGVITNTFAHEVGHQAQGGNATIQRAFDYARIMPQMAEVYNRVSSGLAALEMTNGDVRKAADFIRETHVDYAQSNKTYMGKSIAKLPGANTITMFRTYVQGMRHLLYSNIKNMVYAETKSRAEAAKTVAGMVVAMSLTAGVIKGAALEPLRAAVYAYNKVFGNDDEFYSLDNSIRRFVASVVGNKTLSDAVTGGLSHILGFDLSSRMGLSDLFLHDPPDLLGADKKEWLQFLGEQLGGPMGQMVGEQKDAFTNALNRGDAFGMIAALVPVKLLRDSLKATELATTGHKAANGAVLTKPSVADAVTQVMGFKPASVARVQEKQGDVAQYREFIDKRKTAIMGAWGKATPEQRVALRRTINDFNAKNPGDRIKVQDLIKQQRSALRSQQRIETGNDKNPNIRKLLEY